MNYWINNRYTLFNRHLAHAHRVMPVGKGTLNLAFYNLGTKTDQGLRNFLGSLPLGAVTLLLCSNNLYRKSGAALALAVANIHNGINELDVSNNDLYRKSGFELGVFLANVKTHVSVLRMGRNGFGLQSSIELARAIASISKGVITLDLSDNEFYKKSVPELSHFLAAVPKHVHKLDLSGNHLGGTLKDMETIFRITPIHITHIAFDNGEYISRAAFQTSAPMLSTIKFDDHLKHVEATVKEIAEKAKTTHPNYQKAAEVAELLQQRLLKAQINLLQDNDADQGAFKKACLYAINQARPVLEANQIWKQGVANFARSFMSLLSVGITNLLGNRFGFYQAKVELPQKLVDLGRAIIDEQNRL